MNHHITSKASGSAPVLGDSPLDVYTAVTLFFAERCGDDTEEIARCANRPGLLRTACVGNPERTIHGELFAYLRSRHTNVVLEYRLHSFEPVESECWDDGRSVDIMVLDEEFLPACAIEIKHYGRVQGHIGNLLNGLKLDYTKYNGINLPLVQVGVYTDLDRIPLAPREAFEAFRFISCYAFDKHDRPKKLKPGCDATGETRHDALLTWGAGLCGEHAIASFRGAPEQFKTPAGPVTGRVHYFIGLTKGG